MALVARLVGLDTAAFCVAGVALGGIHIMHAHIVRGARRHPHHPFALCAVDLAFTALGWRRRVWDAAAFCAAGVALGDIQAHFAQQAWRLWNCARWQAWRLAALAFTFCGRPGAHGAGLAPAAAWTPWLFLSGGRGIKTSCCAASGSSLLREGFKATETINESHCVAFTAMGWRLPAWSVWTPRLFFCVAVRGAWCHPGSVCPRSVALIELRWIWWRFVCFDATLFCVAGVAFGEIQAHCLAGLASVAGVALGDIRVTFEWQAWHLRYWAGSGGALGRFGRVLLGSRGTW
eukprot:s901_g6.t1